MTWNVETLAERTNRATAAAAEAGRSLGLTVTDPVVLYDAFSVVVHLKPAPVVARVPVVLPPSLQDPAVAMRRQQTELDVVQWIVEQDKPVVSPRTCLLVPCSREQVLGAVARCAGVKASMFFHRGLCSSAARCRAECRAARRGQGDTS